MKRLLLPALLLLVCGLALFFFQSPAESMPEPVSPDVSPASVARELVEPLASEGIEDEPEVATSIVQGRVDAADGGTRDAGPGELVVRVVSRETKEPLADVRVLLTPHEMPSTASDVVSDPSTAPSVTSGSPHVQGGAPPASTASDAGAPALPLAPQEGGSRSPAAPESPSTSASKRRSLSNADFERGSGRPGEPPVTDAHGVVRLTVDTRRAHRVSATGHVVTRERKYGKAEIDVPAFPAGATCEVELALATSPDARFFGRLVADDEHASPVAGARIRVVVSSATDAAQGRAAHKPSGPKPTGTLVGGEPRPESTTTSRADGTFELEVASWRNLHAWIEAPGRSPGLIDLPRGHEEAESALVVRVTRSASLRASLSEKGGAPARDVALRVSTPSSALRIGGRLAMAGAADPAWQADADAGGVCALDDLPSNVPLTLEIVRDGKVVRRDVASFVLAPGEEKRVELRIDGEVR